jgi:hypothetical protein
MDAGEDLEAFIENQDHVAVELVTVTCAGDCVDVVAVARGGFPPYTFLWEDGSTSAARTLCPDATTAFSVSATDAGITSGEFTRDPETVQASVTAEVFECPGDGGAPPADLCLMNPSIEGTPRWPFLGPFDAVAWDACTGVSALGTLVGNATISSGTTTLPIPTDGATYGVIAQDSGFGGRGVLAQQLCEPVPAGATVSFLVDIARADDSGAGSVAAQQAIVEVWGGQTRCTEAELLWTSPPLSTEWSKFCVTLTPDDTVTSISFRLLGDGGELFTGLSTVAIDNLMPVPACAQL